MGKLNLKFKLKERINKMEHLKSFQVIHASYRKSKSKGMNGEYYFLQGVKILTNQIANLKSDKEEIKKHIKEVIHNSYKWDANAKKQI